MLFEEYINNPRLNQSKLKKILEGVDVFKHYLDNPIEPTEAMDVGSAVHLLVFQPHLKDKIKILPQIDGKTRDGKILRLLQDGFTAEQFPVTSNAKKRQEKNLFYEISPQENFFLQSLLQEFGDSFRNAKDYLFLSRDNYDKSVLMAEQVWKNSTCSYLLKQCTHFEKNFEFTAHGLDFKCQIDGLREGDFILDLKKTAARIHQPFFIKREIEDKLHHFQAATYMCGPIVSEYFVLFVSELPPHTVRPVRLSEKTLRTGRNLFEMACDLYKDCLANNPEFKADHEVIEI